MVDDHAFAKALDVAVWAAGMDQRRVEGIHPSPVGSDISGSITSSIVTAYSEGISSSCGGRTFSRRDSVMAEYFAKFLRACSKLTEFAPPT